MIHLSFSPVGLLRSADCIHHCLSLLNKHPLIPLGHSNSVQTKHRPSLAYKSTLYKRKSADVAEKRPTDQRHTQQTCAPFHKSRLTQWTPSNRCRSDGHSDNESWCRGWLTAPKQKHNNSGVIHICMHELANWQCAYILSPLQSAVVARHLLNRI